MEPGTRVRVTPPSDCAEYAGTATVVEPKPADAMRGCSRSNPTAVRVKYDPPWEDPLHQETVLIYVQWTNPIDPEES